jgi:putative redox protein
VARTVRVDGGRSGFVQKIFAGPHLLLAGEPIDSGGNDAGPGPYELLMAALGACTSMTVQMYAERKEWPLRGVHVELSYARVHAEDRAQCDTEVRMVDKIELELSFSGDLTEEQQTKLMEIAEKCPVHRTLSSRVQIRTQLRELISK